MPVGKAIDNSSSGIPLGWAISTLVLYADSVSYLQWFKFGGYSVSLSVLKAFRVGFLSQVGEFRSFPSKRYRLRHMVSDAPPE